MSEEGVNLRSRGEVELVLGGADVAVYDGSGDVLALVDGGDLPSAKGGFCSGSCRCSR